MPSGGVTNFRVGSPKAPDVGFFPQEVHATVPGLDVAKLSSGETLTPAVTLGEDGNFYLPGSDQILVMLPDGGLVRRIPFDNAEPKGIEGPRSFYRQQQKGRGPPEQGALLFCGGKPHTRFGEYVRKTLFSLAQGKGAA